MTDDQMTEILCRHVSKEWPLKELIKLCRLHMSGRLGGEIAKEFKVSTATITGKVSRLISNGVLTGRGNPVVRGTGVGKSVRQVSRAGKSTLPPLPSLCS